MKKIILTLVTSLFLYGVARSQGCAANCTLYTQSSIAYSLGPTTGNNLSLGDDQLSGACPIGFTFTFFCNAYTNAYICSNGFLSFNPAASNGCCSGGLLPTAGGNPNNLVAFVWTDLYPPGGGTITYTTIGTAPNRVFIASYNNIPYYPGTGAVSGQIKLYETSNTIEIHSTSASVDSHIKTQGIENSSGSLGQATPGRNSVNFSIGTPDAYQFAVSAGGPMAPSPLSGPASVCIGGTFTYSVPVMVGATSYNWSLPGGWTGTSTTNTISVTPSATGVMSVTATYSCGTSPATTLNVVVNPLPVVSIAGGTAVVCGGYSVGLTASGAATYSWSNGGLTASIAVTPTANTTYSVIGTSAAGCTASATKNITVTTAPPVTIAGPTQICIGQNAALTANGATTYSWSNGSLTQNITTTPTVTTTYSVIGTDAVTGCTASASQVVTVNPLPVVTIAGSNTLCQGQTLTLTASGANTYSWNIGPITNSITDTPITNISYTVFGTNTVTGCFNTAVQNVTVNSIPTLSVTGPYAMCLNQTITLNVYGAVTYSWSTGSTATSVAVSPTTNTSYTVTGSTALGCPSTPFVKNITVNPIPVVTITGTSTLLCRGESMVLTAGGVDTYSWNTGALTNTIMVAPTNSATYTVIGTNTTTGCYNTTTISVQVTPCTGIEKNAGNDAELSVYPNPNNGEFTVEFANGLQKSVEVFDVMGRTLTSKTGEDDRIDIKISEFSSGVYYVKVQCNDSFKVIKIIKQ